MKPEKQVCTLEQSKRLRELRVPGDTLLSWWRRDGSGVEYVGVSAPYYATEDVWLFPTYTVAELGEMIGEWRKWVEKKKTLWHWYSYRYNDGRWCTLWSDNELNNEIFVADTEAESRAKFLIYLIETGVLTFT